MPYLSSLPNNAGPPTIFAAHPDIYRPWSEMSEALMNGPSPFSQGERELLLAFAAGVAGCDFVAIAHAEVAYAWGIEHGTVERLLADRNGADAKWSPLLDYVATLSMTPTQVTQAQVAAVLAAGWTDDAIHDAIAIVGRAAFMQRLVQGFGFAPLSRDVAARHAAKRVEHGYLNLYRAFRTQDRSPAE